MTALSDLIVKLPTTEAAARRAGIAPKIVHRADKINANGDVSALCYSRPHKINLAVAVWTIRDDAVTCSKCRAALKAREARR